MDPANLQRGFSLAEATVTLGLIGGLLALALSTVSDVIEGLRLAGVSNDVMQQLFLARSEAIKRNTRVALCKSADGEACARDGGWEQGWILFADTSNNGLREPAEPILQRLLPLPPQYRLSANNPLARYVSYHPLGGTVMASGAFQAGTFTLCRASAGPVEGRKIVINAGGRPRSEKVQLESCP